MAIEVQLGKYAFVAYDLFVKHLAFYVRDEIDVGIEILPTKAMQTLMSSGIAYYEGELYNVIPRRRALGYRTQKKNASEKLGCEVGGALPIALSNIGANI